METLMVVGISAVLIGLGANAMKDGRNQAGAQGLATVVQEELCRCRQEAMSRRRPVAFMIPSNSGNTPSSGSYYVLDGESVPKVIRRKNLGLDYRGCRMLSATWSGPGSWQLATPEAASKWKSFSVRDWLPTTSQKDYAYIFLPDGSIRTNDLPSKNENYYIVVSSGAQVGSGSAPAGTATVATRPSYFDISSISDTQTISISTAGFVSRNGGLEGSSIGTTSSGFNTADATALSLTPGGGSQPNVFNGDPVITPYQDPSSLPTGTDALLSVDQTLTLEIRATSTTGDQLYCNWTVTTPTTPPNQSTGLGTFSIPNSGRGARMEWDPEATDPSTGKKGAWHAIWTWRPPVDAKPHDKFILQAAVQDGAGGPPRTAAIKNIEVDFPGQILFETNRNGQWDIFSMNVLGGQQKIYIPGARHASANPDGIRMVYNKGGNIYMGFPKDPTRPHLQLTTGGGNSIPSISPNGNLVAYRRGNDIYIKKTTPTSPEKVVANAPQPANGLPIDNEKISWNPIGTILLYSKGDRIWAADIDPNSPGIANNDAMFINTHDAAEVPLCSPSWSPSGRIFFENNFWSPTYDPYVFSIAASPPGGGLTKAATSVASPYSSGTGGYWTRTYGTEQSLVEVDPNGSAWVMETWATVPTSGPQPPPIGDHEIVLWNSAAVASGTDVSLYPWPTVWHICRTPGFENLRPVWMKR